MLYVHDLRQGHGNQVMVPKKVGILQVETAHADVPGALQFDCLRTFNHGHRYQCKSNYLKSLRRQSFLQLSIMV